MTNGEPGDSLERDFTRAGCIRGRHCEMARRREQHAGSVGEEHAVDDTHRCPVLASRGRRGRDVCSRVGRWRLAVEYHRNGADRRRGSESA